MSVYLVCCVILCLWFVGAEEECRIMARFREESHPNGSSSARTKNYDNVEIFWRYSIMHFAVLFVFNSLRK